MSSSVSVITPPSSPYWKTSNFGLQRIIAVTRSPFTGKQQVHDFGGAYWQGSLTLPPMKRAQASPWVAFLTKMKGTRNVFLLGDPDGRTPLGSVAESLAVSNDGTHTGAVNTSTIRVSGFLANVVDVLKAGDYIQTGSAATANLYMVVEDVDSDASGIGILTIEPSLRRAVENGDGIVYTNPSCPMRLADEQVVWDVDHRGLYSINFDVTEAL